MKKLKYLQQLGLSYYESRALEILLKEKLTPKALCKKANIPPGKVYSIIHQLYEKGFVVETDSRPKELYVFDPEKVIAKLIDKRQRDDEALFSEIRSVAADIVASAKQPSHFFQLGITLEENREIQLRTFHEAKTEVCQILSVHHKPNTNRNSKTLWEEEIINAIQRGVIFRAIYSKKAILPSLLAKLPANKFQVRRMDTDFVRCDIVDKKKVLLKLVHQDPIAFGGVIFLENERFA